MAAVINAAKSWYCHITDQTHTSEPCATSQVIFGVAGTGIYYSKTSSYWMWIVCTQAKYNHKWWDCSPFLCDKVDLNLSLVHSF